MTEVKSTLNPAFETVALLYLYKHEDSYKEHMLHTMVNLGYEEAMIRDVSFDLPSRYVEEFRKAKTSSATFDYIFESEDPDLLFLLIDIIISYSLNTIEQTKQNFDTSIVFTKVKNYLLFTSEKKSSNTQITIENMESLIDYLLSIPMDDSKKWKLLALCKNPDYYYGEFNKELNKNLPICKRIIKKYMDELNPLLTIYHEEVEKDSSSEVYRNFSDLGLKTIYPSLALPFNQVTMHETGYFGVLIPKFLASFDQVEKTKQEVLSKSKVLSDRSKIDILLYLREKKMYNLEIAEEMCLSPSTTSHHMNMLTNTNLVKIVKEKGKACYVVNEKGIKDYIEEINMLFLN